MRPKKVILCVDDNEQELSVLKFMLATNGYKVISASTGQEAIGVFAVNQVDLVLADYNMPQMNGDQLWISFLFVFFLWPFLPGSVISFIHSA
jgi:two-component system, OmpR family, response regulator CpxR